MTATYRQNADKKHGEKIFPAGEMGKFSTKIPTEEDAMTATYTQKMRTKNTERRSFAGVERDSIGSLLSASDMRHKLLNE